MPPPSLSLLPPPCVSKVQAQSQSVAIMGSLSTHWFWPEHFGACTMFGSIHIFRVAQCTSEMFTCHFLRWFDPVEAFFRYFNVSGRRMETYVRILQHYSVQVFLRQYRRQHIKHYRKINLYIHITLVSDSIMLHYYSPVLSQNTCTMW